MADSHRARLRWVALGASDATGAGTANPDRESWVAQLAAALAPRIEAFNLAVGGALLAEARAHQLPAALNLRPDVVSLWLVVNDAVAGVPLERYRGDLRATLGALRERGIEVVVGNMPDLTLVPAIPLPPEGVAEVRAEIERWNRAIAAEAAEVGAAVVDLFGHRPERAHFSDDGFHPSVHGHRLIARAFRHVLETVIARRPTVRQTEEGKRWTSRG